MHREELKWPHSPNAPAEPGWIAVVTPLGASLHVRVNSPAWDMCTEWQLLNSGRGLLSPTDPLEWFDMALLARTPQGLVAELFASGIRMDDFARLIATDAQARAHILSLPEHVYGAEPEEWELIGECVDIARCLDARDIARTAGIEALRE